MIRYAVLLRPGMSSEVFDTETEMIKFAEEKGYDIYINATLVRREGKDGERGMTWITRTINLPEECQYRYEFPGDIPMIALIQIALVSVTNKTVRL